MPLATGVPPTWIDSAAASESWAYYKVLQTCPETPAVVTDCDAVRSLLAAGVRSACAASRPLARVWRLIYNTLEDDTGQLAHSKLV